MARLGRFPRRNEPGVCVAPVCLPNSAAIRLPQRRADSTETRRTASSHSAAMAAAPSDVPGAAEEDVTEEYWVVSVKGVDAGDLSAAGAVLRVSVRRADELELELEPLRARPASRPVERPFAGTQSFNEPRVLFADGGRNPARGCRGERASQRGVAARTLRHRLPRRGLQCVPAVERKGQWERRGCEMMARRNGDRIEDSIPRFPSRIHRRDCPGRKGRRDPTRRRSLLCRRSKTMMQTAEGTILDKTCV